METTVNNYLEQANDFLTKTGTVLTVEFLKHDKHFEDDKESRDVYACSLTRGKRSYKFNFGQSIKASGQYKVAEHLRNKIWVKQTTGGKISLTENEFKALRHIGGIERDILKNNDFAAPSAYDILACITKYDPGTFEDFCSDFGYDSDSKKAEKVYLSVKDEYTNVCALFNDDEIEILLEIE